MHAAGRRDRQHGTGEPCTTPGLRAETPLAPQDGRPDGSFGHVDGGLDPGDIQIRPEGRPQVVDACAHPSHPEVSRPDALAQELAEPGVCGRSDDGGRDEFPDCCPTRFSRSGRVPPTGRLLPAARRLSPAAQQWLPAGWLSRMASLNRTRKEYHPAPYPRERLRLYRSLFADRSAFVEDRTSLRTYQVRTRRMQSGFGELLTQGIRSADLRVRRMCEGVDHLWPALWTYLDVPGVEPTNNVAERAIRPAVLWRKGSFGTQSGSGARFAGAMLTVGATCRMHSLDLFAYLAGVCTASMAGLAVPHPRLTPD